MKVMKTKGKFKHHAWARLRGVHDGQLKLCFIVDPSKCSFAAGAGSHLACVIRTPQTAC